ncbi:hypothetical protein [Nonomuraea sp. NPDC050783]
MAAVDVSPRTYRVRGTVVALRELFGELLGNCWGRRATAAASPGC